MVVEIQTKRETVNENTTGAEVRGRAMSTTEGKDPFRNGSRLTKIVQVVLSAALLSIRTIQPAMLLMLWPAL